MSRKLHTKILGVPCIVEYEYIPPAPEIQLTPRVFIPSKEAQATILRVCSLSGMENLQLNHLLWKDKVLQDKIAGEIHLKEAQ